MNKKIMLILFIGFSAQVMTNDEDLNDKVVEISSYQNEDFSFCYGHYTETIFLSDIIIEGETTGESYFHGHRPYQYITLKYEDAVRHVRIYFFNDAEKAEQIILAKEYFRQELEGVFHAIKVDFEGYSPCVCGWIPSARLHYSGYERSFGGYIDESFYIRFHNLDHAIFKAKKEFRNWIISQESIYYVD